MERHIHTDDCYKGDFLVCGKTAHTHDGNCYIVLLKENNINEILTLLGENENHSLEHVISNTVNSALNFKTNINHIQTMGGVGTVELNKDTVTELNNTISDKTELPDIVLNENINNIQNAVAEDDAQQNNASGNVTMDVVTDPVTSNYNANFYIYLDGGWVCIGTLPYTTTANGSRYDYTIPTSDVLELVNGVLGTDYAYNSFDISVATSANGSYTTSNVGMASVTTTIAYRQRSTAAKSARYIRLIPNNGSASSIAFAFYTVTYEYPDGTEVSRVVRSGTTVVLPNGNYEWTADGNTYAAGEAVTITKKTNFTGSNIGPITFININYDINFPTVSGVTVSTKPTIAALSTTTVTDGFNEGTAAVIRNVPEQSVRGKVNNNSTGLSRVVQFKGWRVGNTDVILQPNTTLIWEELLNYATGASIQLTAVWEYDAKQTAPSLSVLTLWLLIPTVILPVRTRTNIQTNCLPPI